MKLSKIKRKMMLLYYRGWGLRPRVFFVTVFLPTFLYFLTKHHPLRPAKYKTGVNRGLNLIFPELVQHMEWHPQELILDYGCKDGRVGHALILPEVVKWNSKLYSVDMVASHVDRARSRYPDPRITYGKGTLLGKYGTYSEFPWPYKEFDKIFAIYGFHLIHDISTALDRFKTALKPGGQLAFTSLTLQSWIFPVTLKLYQMKEWNRYMRNYVTSFHPMWAKFRDHADSNVTMWSILEQAGFEVVHLRAGDMVIHSNNPRTIIERFATLTPALAEVPPDKMPALLETLGHLFTEVTGIPMDSHDFNVTYEYFLGVARKPL